MILAAPFDNSSQVKGHRRSLEQQKENLRVLFLPRGRARRAAVEREKIRIDSRVDDLRLARHNTMQYFTNYSLTPKQ